MITFVIGPIGSGKTSRLETLYADHPHGDGFLAKKVFRGKQTYGYDLVRLSTKENFPWMIHDDFYRNEFESEARVGPFHVDLHRLAFLKTMYQTMIRDCVTPIFLDEVGPWELSGQGLDPIIPTLVLAPGDCYIAVREELLPQVISHYHIKKYAVMKI